MDALENAVQMLLLAFWICRIGLSCFIQKKYFKLVL
jgi:hypothetical protein